MPITVRHGPDLRLLGAGGMIAGYGDFQKWQVEQQQREQQLAQQAAAQQQAAIEAQRRTQAGIFSDQAQLQARLFEGQQNRQHDFAVSEDRFQQQAALAEFGMQKQQALQQQQALSNQQIKQQDAYNAYQADANKASQEFDWDPAQQRERAKINEARDRLRARKDYDASQISDGVAQLNEHEIAVVGFPRQRKENPIKMYPAVNGITGQPMTDSRGNPLQGYNNGTRQDIYKDIWHEADAKSESDARANQSKIEADERKAKADAQKAEVEKRAVAEETANKLAADVMKSLMKPDEFTGEVSAPDPEVANRAMATFDALAAGFRQRLLGGLDAQGGIPPPPPVPGQPQGGGLQPIPQEWQQWQSGMQQPMGPQSAGMQQPAPQPQPAQQPGIQGEEQRVVTSARSGQQFTLGGLRRAANKAGIPIETLLAQLQINPADLGMQ